MSKSPTEILESIIQEKKLNGLELFAILNAGKLEMLMEIYNEGYLSKSVFTGLVDQLIDNYREKTNG